jgi:endonuclease YncB( thermonuclease family)
MVSRKILLITTVLCVWVTPLYDWTGKVVGISDGDTIKVLRKPEQVKIRLHGIDTPEKRQIFGNKTKKFRDGIGKVDTK